VLKPLRATCDLLPLALNHVPPAFCRLDGAGEMADCTLLCALAGVWRACPRNDLAPSSFTASGRFANLPLPPGWCSVFLRARAFTWLLSSPFVLASADNALEGFGGQNEAAAAPRLLRHCCAAHVAALPRVCRCCTRHQAAPRRAAAEGLPLPAARRAWRACLLGYPISATRLSWARRGPFPALQYLCCCCRLLLLRMAKPTGGIQPTAHRTLQQAAWTRHGRDAAALKAGRAGFVQAFLSCRHVLLPRQEALSRGLHTDLPFYLPVRYGPLLASRRGSPLPQALPPALPLHRSRSAWYYTKRNAVH